MNGRGGVVCSLEFKSREDVIFGSSLLLIYDLALSVHFENHIGKFLCITDST